jgi:hypothetical protein
MITGICDEHAHVQFAEIISYVEDESFMIKLKIMNNELIIEYYEDTKRLYWPNCYFFTQPIDCATLEMLGVSIFNCIAQTINNLMPDELRWSHPNFMDEIREISETRVDELLDRIPEFDGSQVFENQELVPHSRVCYNDVSHQPAYFDAASPINSWPIFMKVTIDGSKYLINTFDGASSFLVHNWLKLV